jgi:hypothetical protein
MSEDGTMRKWILKRVENVKKRQKDAAQAPALMKELHQAYLMRQAKDEVDAYHARLDDIIRRRKLKERHVSRRNLGSYADEVERY